MSLRNIPLIPIPGYNLPIEDITDLLPKNPKYTWQQLTGRRDINDLTDITVHHSGVLKRRNMSIYNHAINHINGKAIHKDGEPGAPYHIYIRDGKIQQVNNLLDFVYGVRNNNQNTVHICVEGRYGPTYEEHDILSDEDRKSLYAAIISVRAVLPSFVRLAGHGEYVPTHCPGFDMNRVRSDVAKIIENLDFSKSEGNQASDFFKIVKRAEDLYDKYLNQNGKYPKEYQVEAERKLGELYEALDSRGWLP